MTNTEFIDKENWMDKMAEETIKRDGEVLQNRNSFFLKLKKYFGKK